MRQRAKSNSLGDCNGLRIWKTDPGPTISREKSTGKPAILCLMIYSASLIVLVLKKIKAKQNIWKVNTVCQILRSVVFCKPKRLCSFFWYGFQNKEVTIYNPCRAPKTIYPQLAPCQIPTMRNVTTKAAAVPLIPHSLQCICNGSKMYSKIHREKEICQRRQNSTIEVAK